MSGAAILEGLREAIPIARAIPAEGMGPCPMPPTYAHVIGPWDTSFIRGEHLMGEPKDIVSADIRLALPASATRAQIQEWLEYNLGWRATIANANPLIDHELRSVARPRFVLDPARRTLPASADAAKDKE